MSRSVIDGTDYDVLIIGGGPAGSTAAYILSSFGYKVLVIDKECFPRRKLCGGLLSWKTLELMQRIFKEDVDSLEKRNVLNYRSHMYEINYENRLVLQNVSQIPFFFVDRRVFDDFLLKKARKVGARVITGEKVETINLHKKEVTTSNGKIFSAHYIIGADGVNSTIRKHIFRNNGDRELRWQHDLATALQISVNRRNLKGSIHHPVIYFGFLNWGYAWTFPNRDQIVIGLGGLNRANRNKFMHQFRSFTSMLNLDSEQLSGVLGHPVPYGNFLLNPALDNILLVGDAAGFVDPIFGEGIFYAQRTAELASLAILESAKHDKRLASRYLELLWKYVYPELLCAKKFRGIIFSTVNQQLRFLPLQLILRLLDERLVEVIHGFRSYKWFTKKRTNVGKSPQFLC